MRCLSTFETLAKKYALSLDAAIIYIDEAHPRDGWFIGDAQGPVIYNHTDIQHRRVAAEKYLVLDSPIPVYLDDMTNDVKRYFGVQYERLYVLYMGQIIYKGKPGPMGYDLAELEEFIKSNLVVVV